jgi:hypothetical protein
MLYDIQQAYLQPLQLPLQLLPCNTQDNGSFCNGSNVLQSYGTMGSSQQMLQYYTLP